MIRSFRLIGALAFGLAVLAAGAPSATAADGRVPLPNLAAPAKGEACVEPTDVMRRNHMDLLKRQRDETMHRGIRAGKYSLNGCIECHAAAEADAPAPAAKSIEPFCEECHAYAAVRVDCWSCHNPKLVEGIKTARPAKPFPQGDDDPLAMLKAHLSGGSAKP